ncbi:MAG: response regulator [Planctomycetota bacterium]|nr:response regulator [Planctomycetota bacterium]
MANATLRLLLVEDNPADARLLSEYLCAPHGDLFQCTHVEVLTEALRYLKADRFDLILLDLSLPDSQGLDTVRAVARQARGTPIVVLTGLDDETLGIASVRNGAQDYLVKGKADPQMLVRAIRYAVERHLIEEELVRYRDHLEELVAQRTTALSATNEALERQIAERIRVEAALEAAHRRLATDRERQRRLLATELHDSVGQELVGLKLTLEHLLATVKNILPAPGVKILADAADKCVQLIREVRGVCHGLYPPMLESFGIVTTLKQLAEGSPAPALISFRCDEELEAVRYPSEVEIALYRIAQEAVHNALRHSQAKHIGIAFENNGGDLVLTITDDGVGFNPAQSAGKGLGFISMKERVRTAGGRFEIVSNAGETRIEVRIPLDHHAPAARPES